MSLLRHLLATALSALAAALLASGAQAATLQISPVTIDLAPGVNASGLTLLNSGDRPIYGQVRVYRWNQAGGDDALTPTQEVVASPPMIEIGARSKQMIRLVRTSLTPAASEQSYRILIDELPEADQTPANGVTIRLRYSVPVFVEPGSQSAGEPELAWHVVRSGSGWTLQVDNSGSRRAQIAEVQLVNGAGNAIGVNKGLLGYALAGSGRQWQIPLPADANLDGPLKVRAAINSVPIEASVLTH